MVLCSNAGLCSGRFVDCGAELGCLAFTLGVVGHSVCVVGRVVFLSQHEFERGLSGFGRRRRRVNRVVLDTPRFSHRSGCFDELDLEWI